MPYDAAAIMDRGHEITVMSIMLAMVISCCISLSTTTFACVTHERRCDVSRSWVETLSPDPYFFNEGQESAQFYDALK